MVTGAGGLTASEVAQRVANGQTNATEQHTSRSVKEIIRANVLTRFNAILGVLALAVAVTGRWADGLFAVVLVANALIGIVQEVRAKRTLDRLVVLNAPNATVIRDGTVEEIQIGEIVLADLVELRSGDQVPADGEVLDSDGLEVNESALTGESDAVHKKPGDRLLSGTIVVAGSGQFVTDAVGNDAYAHKLAAEVKVFSRTTSEIQASIDTLLRYLTWVILAVSPLLLWSQFHTNEADDWREPVVGSVAALVGMIPEGLVLLTSVAFLLAALTLAKRNVLVQELPAVEVLARVDVVCLDKTGTLTVGDIAFEELHVLGPTESIDVEAALAALAHHQEPNASLLAIMAQYPKPVGWSAAFEVPFSSSRKWSGVTFTDRGTFVLGAPEMVLDETDPARALVAELASKGRRVMALIHSPNPLVDDQLPAQHRAVGVVALAETIRPDARETLEYFGSQGVDIKIISGDNPSTVGAIAREVGLDPGEPVDAREMGDDPSDIATAVRNATVFGRVSPHQKRAMVKALQQDNHVVAMTGDGVNDALALKDADIGVAMGNGAPATRAIAQLVLLDGRFESLPVVLGEGRRVIGNIERVASLFVAKNTYSFLLVLLVSIAGLPFPFLPRHLTLISSVTIGIPAFVLALGPNPQRYRPGFLRRVLSFAIPSGAITGVAIFATYALTTYEDYLIDQRRTAATIAALVVALWIIAVLARPYAPWKLLLVGSMAAIASLAVVVPFVRDFFEFDVPVTMLPQALAIGAAGAFGVELVFRVTSRYR